MMTRRSALAVLTLALVAGGCSAGPRSLIAGEDACAYCRMTIDDIRFGALVLSAKGRLHTFDAIECAAAYVAALPPAEAPRAIWVADFEHPTAWLDATHAQFLHQSAVRSPMGRELVAIAAGQPASALQQQHGGRVITWTDVLTLTSQSIDARPH